MKKGLVHIYYGNGKGKTTASLGLAIRAYGAGLNVLFCQFLKGQDSSELKTFEKLSIKTIRATKTEGFYAFMPKPEQDEFIRQHKKCFETISKIIKENVYDLVILDEIIPTINLGIISLDEVISFIKTKPSSTELVLTGDNPPQELIELSDYASQINAIKHPYNNGIVARKGIEF